MFCLNTLVGNKRLSTQDLLLCLEAKVAEGETDFQIAAEGQHDIGGPFWSKTGQKLTFLVTNPGQRLGAMALAGTEITVRGSAPADVGWLNSGGVITVLGDCGDTAGHCAAEGQIYIGGRAGCRTGSLMKKDPLASNPELWIFKTTGSFSFEFMSGGIAVVCGFGCEDSCVLGERPCVGMVGGVIYVRGCVGSLPEGVLVEELEPSDQDFLQQGLPIFLAHIEQEQALAALADWQLWHKIIPDLEPVHVKQRRSMRNFRQEAWVKNGIFADVFPDNFEHATLVGRGHQRLRVPVWNNHFYTAPCEHNCPLGIATQERFNMLRAGQDNLALQIVIKDNPLPATICGELCPNYCMQACVRAKLDTAVDIKDLHFLAKTTNTVQKTTPTGKHIAIIGSGVAGIAAAWQLSCLGHSVTVYEQASKIGGALRLLPTSSFSADIFEAEIERLKGQGVNFVTNCQIDKVALENLRQKSAAVILAVGQEFQDQALTKGAAKVLTAKEFLAKLKADQIKLPKSAAVIGLNQAGLFCLWQLQALQVEHIFGFDEQEVSGRSDLAEKLRNCPSLELHIATKITHIENETLISEDLRKFNAELVILACPNKSALAFDLETCDPSLGPIFQIASAKEYLSVLTMAKANSVAQACHAKIMHLEHAPIVKQPISETLLHTAWFAKTDKHTLLNPAEEAMRCVSCGTCRDCHTCEISCPEGAISRQVTGDSFTYVSDPKFCIGCGVCVGVCPCGIWALEDNIELKSMDQL